MIATAYVLNSLFNPRGAYLLTGAMIGTVMVANVFFVIIPKQKKAVNQLIAGETPDPALGKAGKQRSLHNNYMTLPVLFIMISHHYPMTYGAHRPGWCWPCSRRRGSRSARCSCYATGASRRAGRSSPPSSSPISASPMSRSRSPAARRQGAGPQ